MTAVAAPAGPEDDDEDLVLERALCRCGRLAAVVVDADEDGAWCSVACPCGAFLPAQPESDPR